GTVSSSMIRCLVALEVMIMCSRTFPGQPGCSLRLCKGGLLLFGLSLAMMVFDGANG
ncbi:hypothetical protein CRENBAI_020740, partial [Crenichthys baileyi]